MRKLIHVTQEDINNATRDLSLDLNYRPQRCRACPVAKAIRRETNEDDVEVVTNVAFAGEKAYDLSRSVTDFINRYDADLPVKPFNFYLKD